MAVFPDYRGFLARFLDVGYQFEVMGPIPPSAGPVLNLRHDIDFETDYALRMAEIEAEAGVRATYYFMLTSDSYNLLSTYNSDRALRIEALGHKISLHFDPVVHRDIEAGLLREAAIFESAFQSTVDIVSIHRPSESILAHVGTIGGIAHTYQPQFSKQTFYCSDSGGAWRFGSPLESPAFAARLPIHLLVHPVWWVGSGEDPQALLDRFVQQRIGRFLTHIESNCKSYRANRSGHFSEMGQ